MWCDVVVDVTTPTSPTSPTPDSRVLFVYQLAPLRQRSRLIGHCGHAVRNVSPEYHRTLGGALTRRRQTDTRQFLIDYTFVYYLHVKPKAPSNVVYTRSWPVFSLPAKRPRHFTAGQYCQPANCIRMRIPLRAVAE